MPEQAVHKHKQKSTLEINYLYIFTAKSKLLNAFARRRTNANSRGMKMDIFEIIDRRATEKHSANLDWIGLLPIRRRAVVT